MDRLLDLLPPSRISFHELSLRTRVLVSQLPFFAVTLVLVAGLWVVYEPLRGDVQMPLALALTVALTLLCVAVPWHRLPDPAFLVVPVLDFVPLTLRREATQSYVTGVGIMAAFPVIWLAPSWCLPRAAGVRAEPRHGVGPPWRCPPGSSPPRCSRPRCWSRSSSWASASPCRCCPTPSSTPRTADP